MPRALTSRGLVEKNNKRPAWIAAGCITAAATIQAGYCCLQESLLI